MGLLSIGVGNTQITGAGSSFQARWPRGIVDGGDANAVAKLGAQDYNGYAITAFAGGTQATALSAGAVAIDFKSTNVPTGFGVNYSRRLSWFTERTGGSVLDGWACWSLRVTAAYDNPAGVIAGDLGIVVTCGNQNSVNADGLGTEPGIIFGPRDVNTIKLQARAVNGAALTVNTAVAAALTPDITKYNTYELQIVTGSAATDPVLTALINGVQVVGPIAWTAAAGLLPAPNAVAGNFGYNFYAVNRAAGGVANMYVHEVVITAGQSAADIV